MEAASGPRAAAYAQDDTAHAGAREEVAFSVGSRNQLSPQPQGQGKLHQLGARGDKAPKEMRESQVPARGSLWEHHDHTLHAHDIGVSAASETLTGPQVVKEKSRDTSETEAHQEKGPARASQLTEG